MKNVQKKPDEFSQGTDIVSITKFIPGHCLKQKRII